jgi:peptidoglycan hydrolase CwlO-like protein
MADTVAVERAKFEELVTKATKYDDIVKTGVTMASDIDNLKRQIKEANSQVGAAQEEATNTRKTLTEFQQQVADKLNSPQDLARILSAIQGLLDSEAQAVKNSEKDAFKLKEAEGAILELKAEIARLQLELKANKSLATATMLQMFTEIIERFKRILNGL